MNFKDTFNYTGTPALSANGPYRSQNINALSQICIPGPTGGVTAAVLTTPPNDADVHVRANVAFFREQFTGNATGFVALDGSTTITLDAPHGTTVPGAWTLVSVSGVDLSLYNGVFYAQLEGTNDVVIPVGNAGDSPTGGVVQELGMSFDLIARLNDDVDVTTFLPTQGYIAQLVWEAAGSRRLQILRYDMGAQLGLTGPGSAYTVAEMVLPAGVVNVDSSGNDLKISQDLRMIVDDDDRKFGEVRVRVYVNNLDDDRPTLDVVDQGGELISPPSATSNISIPRTGLFGFQFFSQEIGMNLFEATDYYAQSSNATQVRDVTLTLGALRDRVKTRVERSTASSFPDVLYEDWIREAQDEIVNELGMMAMFMRNRKVFTLDPVDEQLPDGVNRYILPREIKWIESLKSLNIQMEMDWEFVYQEAGGRMVIDVAFNNRGSGPFDIIYFTHPPRFEETTDETIIPKEFRNVLIQLSIVKAAQYHSDANLEASARGEYVRLFKTMNMSMQRVHQQTIHSRFVGARASVQNRYLPSWQAFGSF